MAIFRQPRRIPLIQLCTSEDVSRSVLYRSLFSIAQTGYSVSGNVSVRKKGTTVMAPHQKPDWYDLAEQASELRAKLATIKAGAAGASSLTAAELRLLPLLSTHLSFREISERLFVSSHTVRTQAYSAYRKLGVSSRSEAVARAHELGLDAL
jgi:DNA-binding CsgD family transcriptional regulator